MPIKNFKDLLVWQRGMELVDLIYLLTDLLPIDEKFNLVSQMRRSATSIPSNIAEGHQRGTKEYLQFLRIAYGSAAELETQLLLMKKRYPGIHVEQSLDFVDEIQRMISTIKKKLLP